MARERPEHGLNWGKSGIYGRGRGGPSRARATPSFLSLSFLLSPFPPIPRSRFLFRSRRGVEREKKERKESPNSKYDDYLQKYSTEKSVLNTSNGTHCVIAHNFSGKGRNEKKEEERR